MIFDCRTCGFTMCRTCFRSAKEDAMDFFDRNDELGCDDNDEGPTNGEFADMLKSMRHEAMALRESCFKGISLEERKAQQELLLGKDFVIQLRRADDWFLEAILRVGENFDGDKKRATFCAQAAVMTHSCHGSIWPHLRFEIQDEEECCDFLMALMASGPETLVNELEVANRAIGIDNDGDVAPPRVTGDYDLDSIDPCAPPSTVGVGNGSKPGKIVTTILGNGLPALVTVERGDERAAVLIHARCTRRDSQGAVLLEVAFMFNTRETFLSPGSLDLPCLQALREEVGSFQKVTCCDEELQDVLRELKENSAKLSAACHMRHREAFACRKTGEEAMQNRVVREPLELSFLCVSRRSAALAAVMDVKQRGNAKFSAGLLDEALALYQEALDSLEGCLGRGTGEAGEEEGKIQANRAECFLRQKKWQCAIEAASHALEFDRENVKARLRRAKAYNAQGNTAAAVTDVRVVLRVEPTNQPARALLKELSPEADKAKKGETKSFPAAAGSMSDSAAKAVGSAGGSLPKAAAWAAGLPKAKQYEWLVDCYRMRVDDDYAWGGGNLRGLYASAVGEGGRDSVAQDFLLFCKLAVSKCVIPEAWNWDAFLHTAKGLLRFAFEKSDAQEKYGSENVFAVAMGGRSLRYTGEVIYGSSIMSMDESEEAMAMERTIRQLRGQDSLYSDVGGIVVWRDMGLAPRAFASKDSSGRNAGKGSGKGASTSKLPCRFYRSGSCAYGENCRFSHDADTSYPAGLSPLCRNHYSPGGCRFGTRCHFRHE
eukprot:TRINITY_DN24262_c0_g1_i2.p1 TRINITY_DN24262_c0_g1~~TRINITY_DN24262_c0_g1_i2.p1  ORF type:complete len:772 (-),score=97.50 TRINITY_DN24262_c0_g1_i2:135-2450(-)